jgi:hypothetical protein
LLRLLHLFGVHRLVYHSGYLDVTAQRQPSYRILRITSLGFELEQGKPRVKEQAEFFYTHLEQPGKKEMPAFMNNNEQG